ncbi:hypothetical protein L1987_55803 [Smallanthus sonchifolius]|uniref:Uncharacterized protein n=1 Tax=Smallanthus sonchifolius TaxID=185202 RepID=A0ACB9EB15_9ASTR|nr:hypothetical protein L1987_55803 [Smallanthus sonchifolius]
MVLASSTLTLAEEANDALLQWPSFTNNHHASAGFAKRVHCGVSIHNVYACLRSSFVKIPTHQHNLLHVATDCCTSMADYRNICGDFPIGKFETFIFPALLFKQCSVGAGDPPSPAPDAAAGPAGDIEV